MERCVDLQDVMPALKARLFGSDPEDKVDSDAVKAAELALILGDAWEPPHGDAGTDDAAAPWGLALSGGGIRSATFALGVLQTLARQRLLGCFHYQSTVSGGGYIGAFLQALIRRHGFDRAFAVLRAQPGARDDGEAGDGAGPVAATDPTLAVHRPIRHLREYSNYLSPRKSPFSGDTLGMVGTYVRNVLLVQLQLCALILAMALLPLLVYWGLGRVQPTTWLSLAGWLGLLAVALLAYVSTHGDRYHDNGSDNGSGGMPSRKVVLAARGVIVALAAASMAGAFGLAMFAAMPWPFSRIAALGLAPPMLQLGITTALLYAGMWTAWLLLDCAYMFLKGVSAASTQGVGTHAAEVVDPPSPLQRHRWRYLLATLLTSVFAGAAIMALANVLRLQPETTGLWSTLVLGPSLVVLAVVLTGIVHVGLAGPAMSDLQREIWARVGGKTAGVVLLGITVPLALVICGPFHLLQLVDAGQDRVAGLGWAGVLAWLSTTGLGLVIAHGKRDPDAKGAGSRVLDLIARIAPWVFILGLLVGLSLIGHGLLQWLAVRLGSAGASLGVASDAVLPGLLQAPSRAAYLAQLEQLIVGAPWALCLLFAGALLLWLLFAWAVNVNEFSLNAFYRNRLVRCYLGASNALRNPEPTTNFDVQDDLVLADVVEQSRLAGQRPLYPLIGTAMNLVAAKQLDWQDRKAATFCLSPGYCGHLPPLSRPDESAVGDRHAATAGTAQRRAAGVAPGASASNASPSRVGSLAGSLSLGSAIAISGAAVNPNMGYHSSPAVTFLLTLFDARLGWWLPNPSHPQHPAPDSSPFFGRWLLAELLGRTHAGGKFVHLSDGGHFENLGLYELVRRRCRFILCVDAGADPRREFADLGNAVHKCRVDFGANLRIDVDALRPGSDGRAERSCAVGRIDYADGSSGTVLYLKPTLTGAEPADIGHYARTHASFPHEATSDQYFDEAQFESYRRLGEDIAARALLPAIERIGADAGAPQHGRLALADSTLKQKLLVALRQKWVAPLADAKGRFAVHADALTGLFTRLRETPALAVLDAQFYPAWADLVEDPDVAPGSDAARPLGRRTRMPAARDFRVCFYFCQELIRLMESVYHDLDLEQAWDHPDNRGWMNAMRHWSWAPMFRIAWTVGAPTFGARFVAFCEQRLDLPRLSNDDRAQRMLRIEDASPAEGVDWVAHCAALMAQAKINHIEHGILTADTLLRGESAPDRLFLLRLRWKNVMARTGTRIPDSTLGIAVLSGGTLRLLRVQDHVRRMGLATEFIRLLVDRQPIADVDVRAGYYGLAGVCRTGTARTVSAWLQAALLAARQRRSGRSSRRPRGDGPPGMAGSTPPVDDTPS